MNNADANQSRQRRLLSLAIYGLIIGFLFGIGGMILFAIPSLIIFLLFSRPGQRFDLELRLITSIALARALFACLGIFFNPYSLPKEKFVITVTAALFCVALLYSKKRILAFVLVSYYAFLAVQSLNYLLHHLAKADRPKFHFANGAIYIVISILLVKWFWNAGKVRGAEET